MKVLNGILLIFILGLTVAEADKHYMGDEHNPKYDHEAFLGPNEAKQFDELTPDESRRRLG